MKNPRRIQLTLLLIAHCALVIAAEEAPNANTSGGITEISVERTRCHGTCPADILVLRADGRAAYTGTANTLLKGEFSGTFWTGDFDRLAHWLVAEGFFQMGDRGDRNRIVISGDTEQVIRVTRNGVQKSVTSYSAAQTQQAWAMGHVIRSLAADVRWAPAQSGIRGVLLLKPPGEDWRPQPEEFIWINPAGTQDIVNVRADREGRYEINLAPGTYVIWCRCNPAATQTVVVEPDQFTQVDLRLDVATRNAANNYSPPPPPPGDGLYWSGGTVTKWMLSKSNEDFRLGDAADLVIVDKQLVSEGPGDSTFRLTLTVPQDERRNSLDLFSLVLVVGDAIYKPLVTSDMGKESTMVGFRIPGEPQAREVGRHFDIPVSLFIRPDFKLNVSLVPTKPSFKRGEAITATLRIVNNGTDDIRFRSPGLRDQRDDYAFTARRGGQALDDISFPGDRGGTASLQYLAPGAAFEDTVDLRKWFDFSEAGTYEIHGTYRMNFEDSREARYRIDLSSWTEYAEADFVLTIE